MNQKAAYAFRIMLSGYLAYLGVKILLEMAQEKPTNMIFMMVMGAIFLVIGGTYAIYCIKKVWDIRQEEKNVPTAEEDPAERTVAAGAEEDKAEVKEAESNEEIENDYEEK